MKVQRPDANLISSGNNFFQALQMIKLKQHKSKFAFYLPLEEFIPLLKFVLKLLIQLGYSQAVNIALNIQLIGFYQFAKVVYLPVADEDDSAVLLLEDEGLVRLEGGAVHDGQTVKTYPCLRKSLETRVVRAAVLELPEV